MRFALVFFVLLALALAPSAAPLTPARPQDAALLGRQATRTSSSRNRSPRG